MGNMNIYYITFEDPDGDIYDVYLGCVVVARSKKNALDLAATVCKQPKSEPELIGKGIGSERVVLTSFNAG